MKPTCQRQRNAAITVPELLVVIVILLIAVYLFVLPTLSGSERSRRSFCASNLKQLALATRTWSLDHGERFPWQVSTNEGGTMELRASPEVFRHFLAMSNELEHPNILVCPSDHGRLRAATFDTGFSNGNLSYFVGLDSGELRPESILSGDRNLVGAITNGALLVVVSNNPVHWDSGLHTNRGFIALSDGRVEGMLSNEMLAQRLGESLQGRESSSVSLAIPRTPQDELGYPSATAIASQPKLILGAILSIITLIVGWLLIRRRPLAGVIKPPRSP